MLPKYIKVDGAPQHIYVNISHIYTQWVASGCLEPGDLQEN